MVGFLLSAARVIGFGGACASIGLWVRIELVVQAALPLVLAMVVLALVAAWASIIMRPFALVAVSIVSFVFSLLSLAFTPIFVGLVGVCNVLYLVAAGLMLVARGLRGSHGTNP